MSKVGVSIINYNSKETLKRCLESIFSQKWENEVEVWVVDNNSPDNGKKMVKEQFKQVRLIESDENGGFAKGQNQALKKMKVDYAVLLNPDTLVSPGAIDKMVSFMKEYPRCGISAC